MYSSQGHKTIRYIAVYSVFVVVLAFIGPVLGGSPNQPGIGFFLWGTAPLAVSLLMRLVTRDWFDLGLKPSIRKNLRWYVLSLLAYPVIMALAVIVGALVSVSTVSEFSMGEYLQTALAAVPFFFIFAIFEEVGWRGYLAPKLASLEIHSFLGYAITAIVWTLWHLPYVRELTWVYSPENLFTFIPRYFVLLFAFSIVYGEIRIITSTFWPAVLMHAINNSFGHPMSADYVTVTAGNEYLGSVSTGLLVITFTMLLGLSINHWRTKKHIRSKSVSESALL